MTTFQNAVDDFLATAAQVRSNRQMLRATWQAFMAYCMCLCALSLRAHGYAVVPANVSNGFWFKCHTRGDPNQCSFFIVSLGSEIYELRMNIDAIKRRFPYSAITLNLDVVLTKANSIRTPFHDIDAESDLIAFMECKNSNGYPELIATFEGQVFNTQSDRLFRRNPPQYTFPCCLLLSGYADTLHTRSNYYIRAQRSLRIFGDLQPADPAVTEFIDNWI